MNGYQYLFEEMIDEGIDDFEAFSALVYARFETVENFANFIQTNLTEEEFVLLEQKTINENIFSKVFGNKKENSNPPHTVGTHNRLESPPDHHSKGSEGNFNAMTATPEERATHHIQKAQRLHHTARWYEMLSRDHSNQAEYHEKQASVVKGLKNKEAKGKVKPHANPNSPSYNEEQHRRQSAIHTKLAADADRLYKTYWGHYTTAAKYVKDRHKKDVFDGNQEPHYDFETRAPDYHVEETKYDLYAKFMKTRGSKNLFSN